MKPSIKLAKNNLLHISGNFCDFRVEWSDLGLLEDGWISLSPEVKLKLSPSCYSKLESLLEELENKKKEALAESGFFSLYTDGSANPNPGPGGWGAVLYDAYGQEVESKKGGLKYTGNGKMELLAVVHGLALIPEGTRADVWIDAKYVLDSIGAGPLDSKGPSGWIKKWKANDWKKADGEPVKNLEEVKKLDAVLRRHCKAKTQLEFKWVKGHSGVKGNERADELANQGRKKFD